MITSETKTVKIPMNPELFARLERLQLNIKNKRKVQIDMNALISCAFETGLDALDKTCPASVDTGQEELVFDLT